VLHENGFTREALVTNLVKGEALLVPGRNLKDRANKVIANFKLALKYQDEWYSGQPAGKEPSGTELEDMLLHVRQQMYLKLKGTKDMAAARGVMNFGDQTEDDMDVGYFFTGYIAFALYSPHGMTSKRLSCLTANGDEVEKVGRAKTRKEGAEQKKTTRETGEGGYVPPCYVRSVSLREKATAAQLAQSSHAEKTRSTLAMLAVTTKDHANLLLELKEANQAIAACLDDKEEEALKSWRNDVLGALMENRKRKDRLNKRSEELVEQAPKRQVTAFYEQIGFQDDDKLDVVVTSNGSSDQASVLTTNSRNSSSRATASTGTTRPPPAVLTQYEKEGDTLLQLENGETMTVSKWDQQQYRLRMEENRREERRRRERGD